MAGRPTALHCTSSIKKAYDDKAASQTYRRTASQRERRVDELSQLGLNSGIGGVGVGKRQRQQGVGGSVVEVEKKKKEENEREEEEEMKKEIKI